MFQKIRNTIIVYFLSIVAIYSLILKQANPTFLQNNEMSVRLFTYGVLNNFGNVALVLLLILIGYCINGSVKWVLKKYFYIYIINALTFIGLFLWSRSFTIVDLYNVILPISRNTYPLVVGAILAVAFKDNTKKWFGRYSLNLILIFYGIVFTLPTLFDKDLFGLGNGNNILTAFLLTTLGVIFSTKSYDGLEIKKLTGVGGLLEAYYDNADKFQVQGNIDDDEKEVISNYSAGLSHTDRAVKRFIKQIDKIDKPITLVFYGDHLPGIYSNIDVNKLESRTADYFIYSNRYARLHGARKLSKVRYISPNDFIALTAKQVNAKVSAYYALLTKVQEELPAMKVYAYKNGKNPVFVNNDGKTVKYRDLSKKQKELYDDLKLVQYDLTAGKQYLFKTNFFNIR